MLKFQSLARLRGRLAWWVLVKAIRGWSRQHMDQFELFKFEDAGGTTFVNIGRKALWPDSYERIDSHGRPEAPAASADGKLVEPHSHWQNQNGWLEAEMPERRAAGDLAAVTHEPVVRPPVEWRTLLVGNVMGVIIAVMCQLWVLWALNLVIELHPR